MRSYLSFLFIVAFQHLVSGQEVRIMVQDKDKEPLVGATVQLMRVVDSTILFLTTGEKGEVVFQEVKPDLYRVDIRYIGFVPLEKAIQVKAKGLRLTYELEDAALDLESVTVTARRPLMRQEEDKTIIDPEPLANTSINALEILEKTPGVYVDQDGFIYLTSATPAVVYINGREQKMSAQDMAVILRSLPPNSILRIEILRTPSAKYDAASSGGIVNVVLKKGVRIGRTGSLNAGMNQGRAGDQFAGFSLNDSGEKTTWYFRANVGNRNGFEELSSERFFFTDSTLAQIAETRQPSQQGYIGYGMGYALSEAWELNYDGRLNGNWSQTNSDNRSTMVTNLGELVAENFNAVENDARFYGLQQELGLRWKIDSLGSEWDTQFSFNTNRSENKQDYLSQFTLPFEAGILGNGNSEQKRQFLMLQSDLTYRLPWAVRLETGAKGTAQWYEGDTKYFVEISGVNFVDSARTNAFRYQENINSAYLQASKNLPWSIILKSGIRMEHTYMKGTQTIPSDTTFSINRVDLFPFVYLSRSLFKIAGYDLRGYMIYRRTIERPGYQQLNPNIRYVDQYLYETGNPALQPQFTDNIEVNISFEDMPIFAIGRNYTCDIFSNVIYQDEEQNSVAVRTFDNVGKNRETYFRLVGAIPPGGTYFFVAGAQYNLNEYDGIYEGRPLTFSRGTWRFFTFHMLSLTKTTRLTMHGFLQYKGQQNFYSLATFGQMNLGLTQTFFDKKLSLSLNMNDVFRTMQVNFRLTEGLLNTAGERYNDNQRFGVNVRYNFGLKKREEQTNMFNMEGM